MFLENSDALSMVFGVKDSMRQRAQRLWFSSSYRCSELLFVWISFIIGPVQSPMGCLRRNNVLLGLDRLTQC